jgi:hypothetical protein
MGAIEGIPRGYLRRTMEGITMGSLLGAIEGLSSVTYGGTIDWISRGLFRDYLHMDFLSYQIPYGIT